MSFQKKSLISNHSVVKKAILAKSVGTPTASGSISAPKVSALKAAHTTKAISATKAAHTTKAISATKAAHTTKAVNAMKAMKAMKATNTTKSFQ